MEPSRHFVRVSQAVVGAVATGLTSLAAVAAWYSAHVTYALPGGNVGRHVLTGGIHAAILAGVAALACLTLTVVGVSRPERSAGWIIAASITAAVGLIGVALFFATPRPVY